MKSALCLPVLIGSALLVNGCASYRVTAPASGCSELASTILTRDTEHAVMGDTGDADLDWKLYGTAETGQLNVANRDKRYGYEIIRLCEVRDAASIKKIERPWYAFWR